MTQNNKSLDLVTNLVEKAKKKGADAADAVSFANSDLSVAVRLGNLESLERSESEGVGLRVLLGKKQAIVSSSDVKDESLDLLVERAFEMAKVSPEDLFIEFASKDMLQSKNPDLELFDAAEPTEDNLKKQALSAEEAALNNKGITNSEGADGSYSQTTIAIATSNDFAKSYQTSSSSLSVSVLAGEGTGMERDYEYTVARFASDLDSPEKVGKTAAEKALNRLGPRTPKTIQAPVIFDPRISKSLLGSFASAINGASIVKGTSFLKDSLKKQVFKTDINIINDPYIKKGLGSKPFDAEGVAGQKQALIENGNLTDWLLDLRSAKKLGLKTNGNASRGLSSAPSPSCSNLYMENGKVSPDELMSDIKEGLYLTETFGMGVNIVTGDYSQGAAGFWIENGQIKYPVSQITIAGNLSEMFGSLIAANDLEFKYSVNCPTVRVEKMTIAGK